MASIYQNAYLTIAATASSDTNGGCFTMPSRQIHDAHKIVTDAYKIAVADLDGKPIEVYARKALEHFSSHFYSTEEELRRFIKSFPPLSRAWVHQERLMSPRVLHFAGYELGSANRSPAASVAVPNNVPALQK